MANILTIIPYKFYPPIGGGALRCYYILREMARNHIVYLLTSQPATDFRNNPNLPFPDNVHIVSTFNAEKFRSLMRFLPSRLEDAINYRFINRSLKGSTNSALLEVYPTLLNLLNVVKFDLIYYESLEALDVNFNLIKKINKNLLHIYDAHNVDSELWAQLAKANDNDLKYKSYAIKALGIEKSLYKMVDSFFCCSEVDYKKLINLNQNKLSGSIMPNGVDTLTKPFDSNTNKNKIKNLLFCGSLDYFPNKQGLLWFYKDIFILLKQKVPEITLTVIGNINSNKGYEALIADTSVHFIGKVESVNPYYNKSSVAVVPLLSGSGTRLKLLEAMSMGNPVVSTSIGAEGIDFLNGEHMLIGDSATEFANHIITLLSNKEYFDKMRSLALDLVKSKYSWDIIGNHIDNYLRSLLG